jgi:hypothetical protein
MKSNVESDEAHFKWKKSSIEWGEAGFKWKESSRKWEKAGFKWKELQFIEGLDIVSRWCSEIAGVRINYGTC